MIFVYNNIDEITENLYLGDYNGAQNIDKIKKLGIKKVLSLLNGVFPKYVEKDNIIHKTLFINDVIDQNIFKHFGECLNFIKDDDKVLVHCGAGASRSASIVVAYIMWTKKMTYKEAFNFVKSKRNIININLGFEDQLELFEKLLNENNYDIDKIKFDEIKWEPKDYDELIKKYI